MNRRVAVRGIFVLDGKLLAVKHKPYLGKPVDYWCLVGGGVDPGTALEQSLEREVLEETGIAATVGRLVYVQQFGSQEKEQMELFFLIDNPQDFTNVDLSKTSHGEAEIEAIKYIDPSDVAYNFLPKFIRTVDLNNLPETVEFFNYL